MEVYQEVLKTLYLGKTLSQIHEKFLALNLSRNGDNLLQRLRARTSDAVDNLRDNIKAELDKLRSRSARSNRISKALQKNLGLLWRGLRGVQTSGREDEEEGTFKSEEKAVIVINWIFELQSSLPSWLRDLPLMFWFMAIGFQWHVFTTIYRELSCSLLEDEEKKVKWIGDLKPRSEREFTKLFLLRINDFIPLIHHMGYERLLCGGALQNSGVRDGFSETGMRCVQKYSSLVQDLCACIPFGTAMSESRRELVEEHWVNSGSVTLARSCIVKRKKNPGTTEVRTKDCGCCYPFLAVLNEDGNSKLVASITASALQHAIDTGDNILPELRMFGEICLFWDGLKRLTAKVFQKIVDNGNLVPTTRAGVDVLKMTDSFSLIRDEVTDHYFVFVALEVIFHDNLKAFDEVIETVYRRKV